MAKTIQVTDHIKGFVKKIIWQNDNTTIAAFQVEGDKETTFKGDFVINAQDTIILHGAWGSYQGKPQFQAASFEYDTKPSQEGLARYLANNPKFAGIGEVKANLIAVHFHENFEETLFNNPKAIQDIAKISEKLIEILQIEWRSNQAINITATKLSAWELSYKQVMKLLTNHGNGIVAIIQQYPYKLIDLVDGYGWKKVDALALKTGVDKESPSRMRACINFCINEIVKNGHCWEDYREVTLRVKKELSFSTSEQEGKIWDEIKWLEQDKQLFIDCLSEEEGLVIIAPMWLYKQEKFIIDTFHNKLEILPYKDLLEQYADDLEIAKEGEIGLNKEQYNAIYNGLKYNISLITGYAGTGKTWVIESLVNILADSGETIKLAAPTGKAARRIEESVKGYSASTIHRLLEYSPHENEFTRNANNPIEATVVILDEVSMCSVSLLYYLLLAIDFTKTRLILVGDHNQLPPVEAGNPLRDIIQKKALPTTILTTVMRNAGALRANSLAILEKGIIAPNTTEDCHAEHNSQLSMKCWYVVDNNTTEDHILLKVAQSYSGNLEKHGFDIIWDVQMLSPVHKGILGVRSMNIYLQAMLQKRLYGIEVEPVKDGHKPKFYIGDKVIQKKNLYDLDIMNGMMGVIKSITKESYIINFGTKTKELLIEIPNDYEYLQYLELGYCCTIHSSQGSEWPCVITLIHSNFPPMMLHRNLLYTALTRARKVTIAICDKKGINTAGYKQEIERRNTFGQYWLNNYQNEFRYIRDRQAMSEPSPLDEVFPILPPQDIDTKKEVVAFSENLALESQNLEIAVIETTKEIIPIKKQKVNLSSRIVKNLDLAKKYPIYNEE